MHIVAQNLLTIFCIYPYVYCFNRVSNDIGCKPTKRFFSLCDLNIACRILYLCANYYVFESTLSFSIKYLNAVSEIAFLS